MHVITVIEYVDKQEIYMTAREMEHLDEIGGQNIFVNIYRSHIDYYTWKSSFVLLILKRFY